MAHRTSYRRGLDLIAVRYLRLGAGAIIEPGAALPEHVREFHRRSLWRRRLVGVKGDAWTEGMLEHARAKELRAGHGEPETVKTEEVGNDFREPDVDVASSMDGVFPGNFDDLPSEAQSIALMSLAEEHGVDLSG